jgi:hypothetical protein
MLTVVNLEAENPNEIMLYDVTGRSVFVTSS